MGSEDDTAKVKSKSDLTNVLVGALSFALGGGAGSGVTLAVTKASVDRLTIQVEKMEVKVESVLMDRVTRQELETKLDKVRDELDKLKEELRKAPR